MGGTPPPNFVPPIPPELTLMPNNWNGGSLLIDITAAVNAGNLTPTSLSYLITDENSTVRFSGAAGTGPAVGGVTLTVSYQDLLGPGHVAAGDKFKVDISPTTAELLGGTFEVIADGDTIASVSI